MKLPDVNILVYAHRLNAPEHAFYGPWLDKLVNGVSPFALSVIVASSFVRVMTQARLGGPPIELEQALGYIEVLSSAPTCRWVGVGSTNWNLVRDLCRATKTNGARLSDVQRAAVAIEHGCTLVSRDRDFQRFERHGLSFELLEP